VKPDAGTIPIRGTVTQIQKVSNQTDAYWWILQLQVTQLEAILPDHLILFYSAELLLILPKPKRFTT
jgi:hypothetical protein